MDSNKNTHVIVGMSGGVDSSVAALRLVQQGYQVSGIFMQNWEDDDEHCTARQDYRDAKGVADKLGIPLSTVNFADEYWERVFAHFLTEYGAGRTPNPDILCNKEIKFNAFLDHAHEQGADFIATGHYAQVGRNESGVQLLRGSDNNKDQSYFLYTLNQQQVGATLFPVGDLDKPVLRQMAQEAGIHVHNKKDSTGICFIGERKFNTFLSEYLPAQPGPILTDAGDHIGTLKSHDMHWVAGEPPAQRFSCTAKVRYRQQDQALTIEVQPDGHIHAHFDEPVRAITPGQSIVLYQGDACLGGGVISDFAEAVNALQSGSTANI